MKKVLLAISSLAALMAVSCNKETPSNGVTEEPEIYEVKIGLSGAITSEITDFTKSGDDDTYDLIGIDVWSCPEGGDTYTRYAYGLFGNNNDITIKLIGGYKYKFAARSADGYKAWSIDDGIASFYGPFDCGVEYTPLDNNFHYEATHGFTDFFAFLEPCELFYGETVDFIPAANSSVSIDMVRISCGVDITVDNLSEGSVTVKLASWADTATIMLIPSSPSYNSCFILPYLDKSFSDATYYEELTVSAEWTNADNVTMPLGSTKVKVMANKLTKIKINATAPTTNTAFSFQYPTDPITDDGGDPYEIGGGETTDTPIE